MKKFKPTYLYIKQHSITGKFYFGKTTRTDVEKYYGTGIQWKNHIAYHGKEHIVTLWYCLFHDEDSIREFALLCSQQWQIVESDDWLNLIPETGMDGSGGMLNKHHSDETKEKLRQANLGKTHSEEVKKQMSISRTGDKNGNFGREFSEEHKAKISKAKSVPFEIVKCPKCGIEGGINNMMRFHFDNCKPKQKRIAKQGVCPHCGKTGNISNLRRNHFDKCKQKDKE